jgi:predicted DNA-binding transcriptional regulator YafY
MNGRSGGIKRSSALTFKRRLLLIRLFVRGLNRKADLIAAVNTALGEHGYPEDATSAFKKDISALRHDFECTIEHHTDLDIYILHDLGIVTLLDLPDTCLDALAFLDTTFPAGSVLPEYVHVRELLETIQPFIPAERRPKSTRPSAFTLQVGRRGLDAIDHTLFQTLQRAIHERRELQFIYRSNSPEGAMVRHRVAPYTILFRPEGHVYLDATTLAVEPRLPGTVIPDAAHYRLDRILPESVTILPTMLPPGRIAARTIPITYHLVPAVARRRDLAAHFPETRITYHDDGSATIQAVTTNLWQARQTLLRYGTACAVTEPPELVELFKATARGLAAIYLEDEQSTG